METLSTAYLFRALAQRRVYFISAAVLVFIISCAISIRLANYQAITTIEVEPSYISQTVAHFSDTAPAEYSAILADRQISQVQQRITADASLKEIIEQLDLYPHTRDTERAIEHTRRAIEIRLISSKIANPAAAQKQSIEQLSAIAFTLSFRHSDPKKAKEALDMLVERFIAEEALQRQQRAKETNLFLQQELKSLEEEIAYQEKEIADFRSKAGEAGSAPLAFHQQASVSSMLALQQTEAQIYSNAATLNALRGQLANLDPYSPIHENGKTNYSPHSQLKIWEAQYASLAGRYSKEHPDIIKLQTQIRALKKQLKASSAGQKFSPDNPVYLQLSSQISTLTGQQQALESQRKSLKSRLAKYEHAIAENPDIEQQLSLLTLDLDNAKERHRALKSKALAASIREKLETGENKERLRVLNHASIPEHTTPSPSIWLSISLLLSLIGASLIVLVIELNQRYIRNTDHLATLIGVAPLVRIPHLPVSQGHKAINTIHYSPKLATKAPLALDAQTLERHHIIAHLMHHRAADAFRLLRTQVLQQMALGEMKTLGITSPRYGDGKTTIAINLALSIALDLNQTVLLVDLDLRKPNITSYMGIAATPGLSDYFGGNAPLSECLIRTSFERLSILPAGQKLEHSSEILGSPKIAALAEELKTRYADRLIIYDLPPVLSQDDPLVFLPHMDGILLIANEAITQENDLKTALQRLQYGHVIGSVLNNSRNLSDMNALERLFHKKRRT